MRLISTMGVWVCKNYVNLKGKWASARVDFLLFRWWLVCVCVC